MVLLKDHDGGYLQGWLLVPSFGDSIRKVYDIIAATIGSGLGPYSPRLDESVLCQDCSKKYRAKG